MFKSFYSKIPVNNHPDQNFPRLDHPKVRVTDAEERTLAANVCHETIKNQQTGLKFGWTADPESI